jgi:CDP-glycerol glycerophosphotransferase (TagB/SpsB family)
MRLVVFCAESEDAHLTSALQSVAAAIEPLEVYCPTRAERALQSAYLASLRSSCHSIDNHIRQGNARGMKAWSPLVNAGCRFLGRERVHAMIHRALLRAGKSSQCRTALRKHRPDLLVVTRVLNWSADFSLLKEAHLQGIPITALVSSWDNLTSKGFFPVGVRDLIVWNEIMQDEAKTIFGFPDDRIHLGGIPRYDRYFRREGLRSRTEFCRQWGLNPDRSIVTFSTANTGLMTHPSGQEPEVEVARFVQSAVARDAVGRPAQLLVRVHPLADPDMCQPLRDLPHVTLQIPGHRSAFRDRLLKLEEERDLAETLWHSDVIFNHASTVTIDAAVFDTPVVCVGFDWFEDQPYAQSTRRFYAQDHYRKLAATGGFRLATSRRDLLIRLRAYLDDPSLDRDGRKAIVKQQCHYSDGRSAVRVAQLIANTLASYQTDSQRAA